MARKSSSDDTLPAKSDAYTGLLAISLIALIASSALMYLDWAEYKQMKPPPVPALSKPQQPAPPGPGPGPGR